VIGNAGNVEQWTAYLSLLCVVGVAEGWKNLCGQYIFHMLTVLYDNIDLLSSQDRGFDRAYACCHSCEHGNHEMLASLYKGDEHSFSLKLEILNTIN
jgi:hypothetical protein